MLPQRAIWAVAVIVKGRPVPQGSMVASYNRKRGVSHVHHVQGSALAMWRASIRLAMDEAGAFVFTGPVRLSIQFGVPRPKAQTFPSGRVRDKYVDARPATAPDLDKLVRAVSDALTGVCYGDDSQVVEILASKVYGTSTYIEVSNAGPPATQGEAATQIPLWMGADSQEDTSAR